jgi:hypothetical protein
VSLVAIDATPTGAPRAIETAPPTDSDAIDSRRGTSEWVLVVAALLACSAAFLGTTSRRRRSLKR